jgi:hypothetical protein
MVETISKGLFERIQVYFSKNDCLRTFVSKKKCNIALWRMINQSPQNKKKYFIGPKNPYIDIKVHSEKRNLFVVQNT